MEEIQLNTRLNVMQITTISSFASIKGGMHDNTKDVYFLRCIGYNEDYLCEIEHMDEFLVNRENTHLGYYLRIQMMPKLFEMAQIEYYTKVYYSWLNSQKKIITTKYITETSKLQKLLNDGMKKMEDMFETYTLSNSESIQKNFMIKLFFWIDTLLGEWLEHWNPKSSYKFVYCGEVKQQEYIFFYFLTSLGFDVLILNPQCELKVRKELLDFSQLLVLGQLGGCTIPVLNRIKILHSMNVTMGSSAQIGNSLQTPNAQNMPPVDQGKTTNENQTVTIDRSTLRHPKRSQSAPEVPVAATESIIPSTPARLNPNARPELSLEELARFASSVVMIAVHDKKGEVFATGSGIVINEKGYILTNNHVASGGYSYSVRLEDDDEIYQTDEVIKYNNVFDLALIRINHRCKPLTLYNQTKPLVRGQKVVAIGSPLGLFNSVSDGIISGFRKMHDVDVIQFTAPISHGSSGGAVMNMQGELIGISTAGFDEGQNINLAVDYKWIKNFCGGFL